MGEYHLRRSTDGTISFTIDMWVRMLLSNWFEINCNILINVITGCAIHILDSGLVVCYLVHLLVHINNLSYERSEIQLPFSSQNAWVSAPILFLALYADLATWQLCGSLWHHAPFHVLQSPTNCLWLSVLARSFFSMGLLADQSPPTIVDKLPIRKWLTVFCNFVWSQKAAIECSSWNLVKKSLLILQLCKKIFSYPFPLCISWVFSFFCVFSLVILTLNQKLYSSNTALADEVWD